MTATVVGTLETRDEGRSLVWDGGEIRVELSGLEETVDDGRRVRAVGILEIRRERGVTSSLFTPSRIEPVEPD